MRKRISSICLHISSIKKKIFGWKIRNFWKIKKIWKSRNFEEKIGNLVHVFFYIRFYCKILLICLFLWKVRSVQSNMSFHFVCHLVTPWFVVYFVSFSFMYETLCFTKQGNSARIVFMSDFHAYIVTNICHSSHIQFDRMLWNLKANIGTYVSN